MTKKGKVISGLVTAVVAAVALALSFIPSNIEGNKHVGYTTNAGELTDGVLVGQTFVAQRDDLSGVSVMFATYSNRENIGVVELHLRDSYTATQDLRVAKVEAGKLSDNKHHAFDFDPVANSKGKTYFFFVVSPGSRLGSSVTVDLDTRDPYHLGTAFIAKYDGGGLPSSEVLARSGKPTVDVPFGTYYQVSSRDAMFYSARNAWVGFLSSMRNEKDSFLMWGVMLAISVIFTVTSAVLAMSRWNGYKGGKWEIVLALTALLAVAVGLRLWYASEMPITNDEGNYLYDAWMLREGKLAGGDGYVKAPLVVAWVALWQMLLGQTVMAGRFASVLAGALTLLPIYFIGKRMGSVRTGLLAAAAWAAFGAPVVFNVYVHTQAVAVLLAVTGIAVLMAGVKISDSTWRLVLAGALLGLGVASRKSVLALGLVPLVVVLLGSTGWKEKIRQSAAVGLGFVAVLGLVLGGAFYVYGQEGFWEAIGFNSAEDGITAVDPEEAEQVREYSLRGMTPFFRESLPFILLALIGWAVLIERFAGVLISKYVPKISDSLRRSLLLFVWIIPALVGWWAWGFFFEYEGEPFVSIWGMRWLWIAGATVYFVVAVLSGEGRSSKQGSSGADSQGEGAFSGASVNVVSRQREHVNVLSSGSGREQLMKVCLPLVWMVGLVVFYISWIKFHANYIVEFLPPLALLVGIGSLGIWQRFYSFRAGKPLVDRIRIGLMVFAGVVVAWAVFTANVITMQTPHTGTFEKGSVQEAAQWAKKYIPANEPIFTGAAIVPYLSGHRTVLDIAHPRWYAYEFTRKDTERLNTFLPPAEEMLEAYRKANWFMLEKQTGFSFLMEYTEIEAGLERDWQIVHEVENGSNTLTFYRRIVPAGGV